MKEIKYLGLDISTSIIGICFLDNNYNLVNLQAINLKKIKCMFQKSLIVKNELSKIKSNYNISENLEVSIEEAFQSFSKGFSSAKTLSQLNRFNGIVSYLTYEAFGKTPEYINVNSARKNLDIKIDRKSDKNTKEQIFEWVQKEIDFDWPTKTLKSGPNKGLVKNDESCYDMSDAYVICRALKYNDKSNN
tara:strand:+ start:2800 stop:3369 length:570 start_codon:yes stop_codon:yes gene_type:complete